MKTENNIKIDSRKCNYTVTFSGKTTLNFFINLILYFFINFILTFTNKIKSLEKENNHLLKIIDKFYETVEKFIQWVCHKFGIGESKELIKNFQEETHTFIDPVKQIENEEIEKEWDLEI